MLARVCRWIIVGLAVLWALALVVFAIGLLGDDRDPLSGVYLMLLGLPWSRLVDAVPEAVWPVVLVLAPGVNVLIVWLVYAAAKAAERRRAG